MRLRIPKACLLLLLAVIASCAGTPKRDAQTPSTEDPFGDVGVSAVRKECAKVLDEWRTLPEDEKMPQASLLLFILSAVYHHDVLGPDAKWETLSEPLRPLVLDIIARDITDGAEIPVQLLAIRLSIPMKMGESVIPLLRTKLETEQKYRKVTREAIRALGLFGDVESIDRIKPFLVPKAVSAEMGSGGDLVTPCYAAAALKKLGDDSGLSLLKDLLSHQAQGIQFQAAVTLAEMGDTSGIPVFEARMRNPVADKRIVIGSVGKLESPEVRKILERSLQFDPPMTAQVAAESLAKQGSAIGKRYLLSEIEQEDLERSYSAAISLAGLRERACVPFLEAHYQDVAIEQRTAACAALASFKNRVGFKDLYDGLQEKRWGYRAASAALLLLTCEDWNRQ